MLAKYTAVIVKSDRWYGGFVKELPGAHSQGKTKKEVLMNLKEAVKMIIDSNFRHSIEGFEKVTEEKISVVHPLCPSVHTRSPSGNSLS